LKLHIAEWGGGDRLALLIHGLISDHGGWHRLAPALVERGWRVLAPDLRGHGFSPRGDDSPKGWADDLVETLPPSADLALGHSLGGMSLALAADRLRPRRAAYVDPAWRMTAPQHRSYRGMWREQLGWSKEQLAAAYPRWPPSDVDARWASQRRFDPRCIDGMVPGGGHDHAPRRATVPSLVLLADPSDFVSAGDAEELRRGGFTVQVVAGAGHSVFRDDFESFLSALDRWLRVESPTP
jgi:pimeloyl-ACP methyl ester carboxylesterase